jgi:uncharacterized protein (DUF1697 family)
MKYISLLRGINVSGQKAIKMPDLKILYEALGYADVVTYIQSGNVVFTANDKNKIKIKNTLEDAIKNKYKFQVPVEIRLKKEFEKIIKNNPFGKINLEKDGTRVLVSFLATEPIKAKVKDVLSYVSAPDKLEIKGKEIYLFCPNGYGKSKLSNTFLEKKLGVVATTRNWKSVVKLYELTA